MPILRDEIPAFARLWNVHRIRRQPQRPNCVAGQPLVLYNWPKEGIENHGLVPDQEVLREIQGHISNWGKLYYYHWVYNDLFQIG
jgi:hypothetical protein